jgi:uncharacterized membrane protein YccC
MREMRRPGLFINWFAITAMWALSGLTMGANVATILFRHLGTAKAEYFISYGVIAIVVIQLGALIQMQIRSRRVWKAIVGEHDAMLDRMKESLLKENPTEREAVNQFIGDLRRKMPR